MPTSGDWDEAVRRISENEALNALRLNQLGLEEVPPSVASLANLHIADLSDNALTEVPTFLLGHSRLYKMDLSRNRIRYLPDEVGALRSIRELRLADNDLRALPHSLRQLELLTTLDIRGNPELHIPPEIGEQTNDPSSILDYYYRNLAEEPRRLNEAKVLVVGQGGVGKTSLVNRILFDHFDPDETKTQGIKVEPWLVAARDEPGFENESVKLNVWDFGGQEIMHATHQFFLTKRSIYLVVVSARQGEEEGRLHYWLRIVQSFGADSPVVVVVNQEDEQHLELNETRLQKDYPTVAGFAYTSCKTGLGIRALVERLQEIVHELPHVYDRLPETYFAVKVQLEWLSRSRDFVSIEEYQGVCAAHNLTNTREQARLLRFLHDLGSVLNFDDPDDPFQLRDTNILNPSWVTTGVYRIINNNALMQAGGVLSLSDLEGILEDEDTYPRSRYGFIIGMMRRFELCFDFPDSGGRQFLIPELLSKNEPDLDWHQRSALRFEIAYDSVVPPGIVSRFIVRMHAHLTENPTYWRTGVVLQIDGCRCQIRSDQENKRLVIHITGPSRAKRRALAVIRSTFAEIHGTIPSVGIDEMVPLPGHQSVSVPYSFLLELERAGVGEPYRFPGAQGTFLVRELLDGVDDERTPSRRPSPADAPATDAERVSQSPGKVGGVILTVGLAVVLLTLSLAVATRISGGNAVPMLSAAVALILIVLVMSSLLLHTVSPREAVELLRAGLTKPASPVGEVDEKAEQHPPSSGA